MISNPKLVKYLSDKIENQNVKSILDDFNNINPTNKELLIKLFNSFETNYIENSFIEKQIEKFNNSLLKFANFEFNEFIEYSNTNESFDSLVFSINSLGEELNHSIIAKEYLTNLFNSINDLIFVVDNLGFIQFANNTALKKLDFTFEELKNKNINLLVSSIIFFDSEKSTTKTLMSKQAEDINVSLKVSPFVSGDKEKIGYVIIAQDISELLKYQEYIENQNKTILEINEELKKNNIELQSAKLKAEESERLKTSFLRNVSHEIRTPLNAIIGFSNLLKSKNLDDSNCEFINIINNSSYKLLSIVDDILNISLIETNQIAINKSKVNVKTFATEIYKSYSDTEDIEFTFNINDECIDFEIDKELVKIVLKKLLDNAFKFTTNGKIEFGIKKGHNSILFYIKDTGIGIGISKEKQSSIFESFRQANEGHDRIYDGTGLGLAISKGIIELHNGKIWVESEENIGSTFYFTIPI